MKGKRKDIKTENTKTAEAEVSVYFSVSVFLLKVYAYFIAISGPVSDNK